MMDLIDRADALMYLNSIRYVVFMCGSQHDVLQIIKKAIECIQDLPSAEPEIIRCKDCKHWREHKYAKETKRYIPFCGFNAIYTKADDFCSRAERRTDERFNQQTGGD